MSTHEKPSDRGARRGRELLASAARELHQARVDRGLSLKEVGASVGLSESQVSRIERGLVAGTSIGQWAQLFAVVGLDLSVRAFAGGTPLRDQAHVALLGQFRSFLHGTWRWATEVPLPIRGDARAWDALVSRPDCRYGIEAKTAPMDSQALARRVQLKMRDGAVDGVILLLPRTRQTREFIEGGAGTLGPVFPIPGARALELLRAGVDPGGSAIVTLDRRPSRRAPR